MRVAIVGAGLSGLACAHELERLGVSPVIFEKRTAVGNTPVVLEIMAQFMHFLPHQDIFMHIQKELRLPLRPHSVIRSIQMHSPREEATLNAHIGYITIRGDDERSLERQLMRHIVSEIRYGTEPDIWELRREFDWVVVATGNYDWSRTLSSYTPHMNWSIRAAAVTGEFDPSSIHFFFSPRFTGTGYGMLAPIDEQKAMIGIAVPSTSGLEFDAHWRAFRNGTRRFWTEDESPLTLEHFHVGMVKPNIVGNVMLIGQAGGFAEPLGFTGQCPSLSSGVMAARQMVLGDRSLERFARQFRAFYKRALRIRRNVNAWDDTDMDRLVRAARYGGTMVAHSPISLVGYAGFMLDALRMADDPSPDVGPG